MKRGALLEDRGRATEGRIRVHIQVVQEQSESTEKRYKDVVDKLHPSLGWVGSGQVGSGRVGLG